MDRGVLFLIEIGDFTQNTFWPLGSGGIVEVYKVRVVPENRKIMSHGKRIKGVGHDYSI